MRIALMAVMVLVCLLGPFSLWIGEASAGVNGGGSIIVHTNDAYTYLSTTICTTTLGVPASCAAAITRTDKSTAAIVWFLASFAPEATPTVAAVYFGIRYDDVNLDPTTKYHFCGPAGSIELPDQGWPANNAGTSLGFGTPVTGNRLFPFYYFKIDDFSGGPPAGPFLCSAINPTGGYASFYNNTFPVAEDRVTRFGCVKWYSDNGYNTCPVPPPPGACCISNGDEAICQIVAAKSDCDNLLGVYQGDDSTCDTPCSACCYWADDPIQRRCVVTTELDCLTGTWSLQHWYVDGQILGSAWSDLQPDGTGYACTPDPYEAGPKWWCQDPRDFGYTGACCFADGQCALLSQEACHAALDHVRFLGYGTGCAGSPCSETLPIGACCFAEGHCELLTEQVCLAAADHLLWAGASTSCQPVNPCPQPEVLAACCNSAGGCTLTTEANCMPPSVWHAEWLICTPGNCPSPVPTKPASWGHIKAMYR